MSVELKARRIKDACRALGVGKSTLYKLRSEGKLRMVRIAGRTLVPESEIDRLASNGTYAQSPSQSPRLTRIGADSGGQVRKDGGKYVKIINSARITAEHGGQ